MTRKEKEIEAIKCLAVQLHSLGWSPGKTIDQVLDWCRSFVTVEMFDGEISNVVFDQWLDCEVIDVIKCMKRQQAKMERLHA